MDDLLDTQALTAAIMAQFVPGPDSIHGLEHWQRVDSNGGRLADGTAADVRVIRLFSLFHDACRIDDFVDYGHGARGAELAIRWRGRYFDLDDAAFEKLVYACRWHTDRTFSDDLTIAICWDSDRLDLPRVGIRPDPELLNTGKARDIARNMDDICLI